MHSGRQPAGATQITPHAMARDYARNRASVLRKRARHGEVAMPRQNVMRLDRSGAYFQFLHPEHVMIR